MEFLKSYGEVEKSESKKRPQIEDENLKSKKICLNHAVDLELPSFIFDREKDEKEKKEQQEKNSGRVRQFEHMKGFYFNLNTKLLFY